MDEQRVVGLRLLETVRSRLADRDGLAGHLQEHWSPECLVLLLGGNNYEVVKTAAICLGLIGGMSAGPALLKLLRHDDPTIVDAAEDALWSIWFRAGGPVAQPILYQIEESINDWQSKSAIARLTRLLFHYPAYAEIYHQRGQAHYLNHDYPAALRDAQRAHELNPLHFAALALAAHSYSALGRFREAHRTYQDVLKLHPQMPGIRTSIEQNRLRFAPASDAHVSV